MNFNALIFTWVLRGIGILLLLPVIFTKQFLRFMPGLADPRMAQFFLFSGVGFFALGAILYFIFRRRPPPKDKLDF